MNTEQYDAFLEKNNLDEPAHLIGRSVPATIKSPLIQGTDFDPVTGPSVWLRAFDNYLISSDHIYAAGQVGKLVVHERVDGVAVFLGFEGTDRVVLGYKDGQRRFNSAFAAQFVRPATRVEIAAAQLDGKSLDPRFELTRYRAIVAQNKSKLETQLFLEQQSGHEEIVAVDEEAEVYVPRRRPAISISVEGLIDLADVG